MMLLDDGLTVEQLQTRKLRLGDILLRTITYSSLGPSTYGGPIISTNPIVVYPDTGSNSYHIPVLENERTTYSIVKNTWLIRTILYINALVQLSTRSGKK